MIERDELLSRLQHSDSGLSFWRERIGALDLRGRVLDKPLEFIESQFTGPVDLSGAALRCGLSARDCRFDGPLTAARAEVHGDVNLSGSAFHGPADISWTRVFGRVYIWRARFHDTAKFFQLMCSKGSASRADSYLHEGEFNLSWSWFYKTAAIERCHFNGPVYFWRTRFLGDCSFNESSFARDATFMGKVSEVCFSRNEIGWDFFDELERSGLLRPDYEAAIITPDGRERAVFAQLAEVDTLQQLQETMAAARLQPEGRARLEKHFRDHSGPMFASNASLQRMRFEQPKQVRFIAVNASDWSLSGTDAEAISFFNSNQDPVPPQVGLGHVYDSVFISYGGPDQEFAGKLNHALARSGVNTFYYPEDNLPGRLIDDEMVVGVGDFDRVLLLCSLTSPQRPGWRFEVKRALEREQKAGAASVLLPVAIDEGLWTPWPEDLEPVRHDLLRRNVSDFRSCGTQDGFNEQLGRLLRALSH